MTEDKKNFYIDEEDITDESITDAWLKAGQEQKDESFRQAWMKLMTMNFVGEDKEPRH